MTDKTNMKFDQGPIGDLSLMGNCLASLTYYTACEAQTRYRNGASRGPLKDACHNDIKAIRDRLDIIEYWLNLKGPNQ